MINAAIGVAPENVIHGQGLVALRLVRCGELVWRFDPDTPVVPCSEVASWTVQERGEFGYVGYQCSDEGPPCRGKV